jgi:EpsI family protein
LDRGNRGRTIWYWYWVDGTLTGNPYLAKLLQAKVKLFGGIRSEAIIVAASDYGDVPAEGQRSLEEFAARLGNLPAVLAAADTQ